MLPLFLAIVFASHDVAAWASPSPPCTVDVPIYGPSGARVDAEIVSVEPVQPGESRLVARLRRNQIVFDEPTALPRRIQVTFKVHRLPGMPPSRPVYIHTQELEVVECQQRISVRVGEIEGLASLFSTKITGRLTGCRLGRDHWIRAAPMFGTADRWDQKTLFDGTIDPRTGEFHIPVLKGVRHMVIAGSGQRPLVAFGVNVTTGWLETRMGDLDLRRQCEAR